MKFGRRQIGEIVRYLSDKNKNFACLSNCRYCADRVQNLPWPASTMYSECSRFHPNRFTFGGVIAERVNTAESSRKVNPIFGRSLAMSRIIISPPAISWCRRRDYVLPMLLSFLFKLSFLLFDNGWTDRNTDCCANIDDESATSVKNFANFGPVTTSSGRSSWLVTRGVGTGGAGSATASPTSGVLEQCTVLECRILHLKFRKSFPGLYPEPPSLAASRMRVRK